MANTDRFTGIYNTIRRICEENHAESIMVKLPRPTKDRRTWTITLKDIRSTTMRERVKVAIGQDLCESVELVAETERTLIYEMRV